MLIMTVVVDLPAQNGSQRNDMIEFTESSLYHDIILYIHTEHKSMNVYHLGIVIKLSLWEPAMSLEIDAAAVRYLDPLLL